MLEMAMLHTAHLRTQGMYGFAFRLKVRFDLEKRKRRLAKVCLILIYLIWLSMFECEHGMRTLGFSHSVSSSHVLAVQMVRFVCLN